MSKSIIIEALQFAALAHRGQIRKYNGRPYITHPIRVAGRVAIHEIASDELVAAAALHDTVEDCGISFTYIANKFGSDVASYVGHLTNSPKVAGQNRAERKREEVARIADIPHECKIIKLIDRIDNLSEIDREDGFAKVYARESLLLLEVLRDADSELAAELEALANGLLE